MGTKNNPSAYDCYKNADPDEPMFILLGRDRHASALVYLWAKLREMEGESAEIVAEARQCALEMEAEAIKRHKPVLSLDALLSFASSTNKEKKEHQQETPQTVANADLAEGDTVITSHGRTLGIIKGIVQIDEKAGIKKFANVSFNGRDPVTVDIAFLRRPTEAEIKAFK